MVVPLILGIDPDTRSTGWAIVEPGRLVAVGVIRADGFESMVRHAVTLERVVRQWQPHMVVVEGQQIYSKSKAQHASIMTLCSTAGAIYGQLALMLPKARLEMPLPAEWKGQTPKPINQGRSYTKLGIPYQQGKGYSWPTVCDAEGAVTLRQGDWEHVGDAVGLALWGLNRLGFSR